MQYVVFYNLFGETSAMYLSSLHFIKKSAWFHSLEGGSVEWEWIKEVYVRVVWVFFFVDTSL